MAASPTLNFPPPPGGQVGVPYSDQLTLTGGTGPFAWSVSSGTLPPGVTLNPSTGLLSGTPTTIGSYPFTVLTKMADTASIVAGGKVTYTVTVASTGQTHYQDAGFTDSLTGVLDDAAFGDDASATTGTVGYTAPTLTWTGTWQSEPPRPSPTASPPAPMATRFWRTPSPRPPGAATARPGASTPDAPAASPSSR
ncbi:hypothetical protein Acor_26590 [Acrocarpospora corrugata]|uniref:Dystroglycan-type cadherin-like domain-containing protein n=1 Tax=Acrocarpospora corrugata TaxID=35763 RepID=A0A5M3VUY0_9ACTN|nr:Ig domain-containing protein [Acrocarpospora corrugata]GES00595.1 hypothetical protein Acor_26590 [Acrocarpospora corrugata]